MLFILASIMAYLRVRSGYNSSSRVADQIGVIVCDIIGKSSKVADTLYRFADLKSEFDLS
jgi:hypothetical protein